MVEDEHRRTFLGEVLLADHVEVHAVDGQHRLWEGGGEEVDSAAAAAGQKAPPDGAVSRRDHRAHAEQVAHLTDQPAPAPAVELQNGPAPLARYLAHLVAGIGGPRVPDEVHQCDVLVAVGIEVAVRQVDSVLVGELLHGVRLARTPQDRRDDLSGQHAVTVDLEPVGQGVRNAEEARDRIDLDGQRRRAQHHGVAALHVRLHQFAHLGIDPLLDLLGEQPLPDLLEIRQGAATQKSGGPVDEVLELDPAELVSQAGGDHADEFADAHVPLAESLTGQDHGGEPGHQRSVDVEESTDLRAARAGQHLGYRSGQSRITHE